MLGAALPGLEQVDQVQGEDGTTTTVMGVVIGAGAVCVEEGRILCDGMPLPEETTPEQARETGRALLAAADYVEQQAEWTRVGGWACPRHARNQQKTPRK